MGGLITQQIEGFVFSSFSICLSHDSCIPLKMADTENPVAQTILHLRPQSGEAIEVLDILANEPYVFKVAPPPEPVDIPLGGIPDLFPTTHLSPYDNASHDYSRVSRESSPGIYSVCPRVLRLGFKSVNPPSPRGFTIGSGLTSDVKVPYYSKKPSKNPLKAYCRIHYNFSSGALLITALDEIKVGSAILGKQQSLLIMAGTSIHCGGEFEFAVEFPDLSNYAEEHERNYQAYAAKLGFPDAQYLLTPRAEYPSIGAEHKSVAILGKGGYGEVHKALKNKTAEPVAIKILSGGGKSELKEVNIMSRLCHVGWFLLVRCHLLIIKKENIIKYERAFGLPSGQICIVMELGVNDLHTQLKARQNSKRRSYLPLQCIRSIGQQALSGLVYLHGEGVMHRDLKPQNILVTEWDAQTDIPTIKLGDFGLGGISSRPRRFAGRKDTSLPRL